MLKFEFLKQLHTKHNKFRFFFFIDKNLKGETWYFIQKKLMKNISSLKWDSFFMKTQENRFNFHLNFILKPWCFPLGLYQVEYKIWETLERETA
jgi:hypothetical protein